MVKKPDKSFAKKFSWTEGGTPIKIASHLANPCRKKIRPFTRNNRPDFKDLDSVKEAILNKVHMHRIRNNTPISMTDLSVEDLVSDIQECWTGKLGMSIEDIALKLNIPKAVVKELLCKLQL